MNFKRESLIIRHCYRRAVQSRDIWGYGTHPDPTYNTVTELVILGNARDKTFQDTHRLIQTILQIYDEHEASVVFIEDKSGCTKTSYCRMPYLAG